MIVSSSAKARLSPVVVLSLLLLGLSGEAAAAEQTFFAIRRAGEARFLPLPGASGQILPAARFFTILRAPPARPEPLRRGDGPPAPILPDRAFLGLPPAPAGVPPAHIWPVDAAAESRISSSYGWRRDPFTGERAFHEGLDIAAAAGTAVVATAAGVVKAIGEHSRLGNYVVVTFADGSVATYAHLRDLAVGSGETVRRGQELGSVGSGGRSTGPHLHYHLEVDGQHVDPLPLLRVPARLAAHLR